MYVVQCVFTSGWIHLHSWLEAFIWNLDLVAFLSFFFSFLQPFVTRNRKGTCHLSLSLSLNYTKNCMLCQMVFYPTTVTFIVLFLPHFL